MGCKWAVLLLFKFYLRQMKKVVVFLSLFIGGVQVLSAQNNVVSAGNSTATSAGSLSYTLGYLSTSSMSQGGAVVSEGLQHAYEIYNTSSVSEASTNFNISVYPNPSVDVLNLEMDKQSQACFTYQLFDLIGKKISEAATLEEKAQIDMKDLSSGNYLLIVKQDQNILKSFRIIKK